MFLWVNGAGEVMSGLYFPVLIGKEIRVFSQFKHLAQGLIPVLQLLIRTCASRNQTVTAVFFLQGQDATA